MQRFILAEKAVKRKRLKLVDLAAFIDATAC
jgi:hypothetical protein